MRRIFWILLSAHLCFSANLFSFPPEKEKPRFIQPVQLDDGWRVSTPAAEGMDQAQIAQISADIESGRVAVGAKLSSEAALAQQYGVSRSVIREALRSCTALGLTMTRTGWRAGAIGAGVAIPGFFR